MARRPPRRVVVDAVTPEVAHGTRPAKRVVGEPVTVGATVFADGHDLLHVVTTHRAPGARWSDEPMIQVNPGLDRWEATFTPLAQGIHRFRVLGWVDHYASWLHGARRKLEEETLTDVDLLVGANLLEDAASGSGGAAATTLLGAAAHLRDGDLSVVTGEPDGEPHPAGRLYRARLRRADATKSPVLEVLVERERALFSTWYELFPRSWSTDPEERPHGTLADVAAQLDHVADMGFDVLYLPPIHPIGRTFRKGRDNAVEARPGDPGSPWAIGSEEGGHTAVHPQLGTVDDLRRLAEAARDRGMELALDLALQCSPDHPWVTEHPEWFRHRPDGTIQYAENPPKRYQDIYPFDFECQAWESLWEAVAEVARFWLEQGVTALRVDNPHTKPFAFWEWFIAELRRDHPDTIFLSEAFTRPEVMHRLACIGFTQSYTYFTWRVTKHELTEYFTELSNPPGVDRFRPNVWPNTPDILPWHLQRAPREAFAVRALLAATLSASYGVYGPAFELAENTPADNGKEEYARSEKYEIRRWDLHDPASLRGLLTVLNRARRDHLALHTQRTLRFHSVDDDHLICYSKAPHSGPDPDPRRPSHNAVLVVANLDPHGTRSGTVHLDLAALGVDPCRSFRVHDLLGGGTFEWSGTAAYVELHPSSQPGHLLLVSQDPHPHSSTRGTAGAADRPIET